MILNAGNYQEQVPSWLHLVIGTKGGGRELSPRNCSFHYQLLCTILIFKYVQFSVLHRDDNGTPLQYSCLENPMDGGAWWAAVHGVANSWTQLSDFTFTFHFHALEKEMATHSSVLAWRIPGTGEPGGLPSMGSQSRTRLKRLSSSSSSSIET